jgi:hypothetical protein
VAGIEVELAKLLSGLAGVAAILDCKIAATPEVGR